MRRILRGGTLAPATVLLGLGVAACDPAPTAPPDAFAPHGHSALANLVPELLLERPSTREQVNLTFDKTALAEGVWEGEVAGDIEGDLRTELQSLRVAGPIWHVDFLWIIDADDPERSLTFEASGTLNTETGRVVMNGTVVEGYLEGARVHEEGQAQVEAGAQFKGIITIMRRSE